MTAKLTICRHKFHLSVVPNVDDIVPLMSKYINDGSAEMKTRQEAMRCFQARFSLNPAQSPQTSNLRLFTDLIIPVMGILLTPCFC